MKYRKLRIAWSATWGLVAVLLIVLWVRSYQQIDEFGEPFSRSGVYVLSQKGNLSLTYFAPGPSRSADLIDARVHSVGVVTQNCTSFRFDRFSDWFSTTYLLHHWLPVAIFGAIAPIPWIPWAKRFSLRTALIATTLVAVVLGLIIYATRG